jgi:hypothetical protein
MPGLFPMRLPQNSGFLRKGRWRAFRMTLIVKDCRMPALNSRPASSPGSRRAGVLQSSMEETAECSDAARTFRGYGDLIGRTAGMADTSLRKQGFT